MAISNGMRVIGRGLKTTQDLFIDAMGDPLGTALPLDADKILTPSFLNHLLQHDGLTDLAQAGEISSVELLNITAASSNCNNLVIGVKWHRKQETANHIELPDTLFIKLPVKTLAVRLFMNLFGSWQLECDFYRNFSDDFPVRLPKVHAVATKRSRFVLMQENLNADSSVQLFSNVDMINGPSLERVRHCLSTFAKIHAAYADTSPAERERCLPIANHPYLSPEIRALGGVLNNKAAAICRKRVPHLFPADVAATHKRAMANWDKLIEWWFSEPLTLIHGDSHIGNFFVSGNTMGMLDWQAAHWGKGIRDVQYFLIDSLPVDILAEHEQELVRHYIKELENNGVELSFEKAWEQYRAFSFHTLFTIVTSYGLGGLTEADQVMDEVFVRAVAAIKRVKFAEWLDQMLDEK